MFGSDEDDELFALTRGLGRGRGRAATTGTDVAVWGRGELSAVKVSSVLRKSAASRGVDAAGVEGSADKVDGMLWNAHHCFLNKTCLLLTWEQLCDYLR